MSTVITRMGKKRKDATEGDSQQAEEKDQVRLVLSVPFKEWLRGYAGFRDLSMTDTIVQALKRDAKVEGYDPPPKR